MTGVTHRAIQTVTGDVLLGTTSGNVMIGTTTAGGRFTIQPTNNQVGMAISGSSLTGSNAQSLVSLSQTWNTTGNPTAFLLNITNTASGATADLMDLQVGGASRFEITAAGRARLGAYGSGTITGTATYNLAVDSSGNVIEVTGGGGGGIGGSGTTNYLPKFTASTTLGNSQIFDDGTNVGVGTATAGSKLQINGNAAIGYSASTAAPTNGLAVAGNVGIGIAAPATNLHVYRTTAGLSGMQISNLTHGSTVTDGMFVGVDDTQGYIYMYENLPIQLSTNSTVRLFINNDGTVFVGGTNAPASPTTGILSGSGATGTNVAGAELRIRGGASTGSGAGGPITFYTSAAGSSGTGVNAATERMRIYSDGMVRTFMSTTNTTQYFASARITIQQTSATNNNFANLSFLGANSDDAAAIYSQISAHTAGATSGNLVFATSNAASASTARMTITSTGLVGINTQTIGSQLQVNGGAAIGYSASTAAPTNGLMVAGNVGVNVTPSAWASGFRAIQIGARSAVYNSDINFTGLGNNIFYDGSFYRYITTAAISTIELGAGVITFGNAPSGTAGAIVSGTERMRIAADGNVGIGATSPSRYNHGGTNRFLEIYNTATTADAQAHVILTTGAAANTGSIGSITYAIPNTAGAEKRGAIIQGLIDANSATSVNARLEFLTASAGTLDTRMIIAPAGNVGINTSTIGSRLQVNGNAAIGYSASTAAPTNGLIVAGSITGASNSNTFGTSSASGYPVIINTGSGSNSLKINGRNNAPGDESGIEFFRFDGVTRVAFIQASTNFFAFATSSEAMRINSSNFLGIGTTTIGSRLQVNGGAAIGYSASTAAPTNGLAVAGNIALNSTLSGWISPFNVIEGNTYAGYVGFQTNAADMKVGINNFYDGTGTSGYKYKTTNGAVQLGLSAANGFQVNVVTSGTANTNFVWTQAMLINLSGEVKLTPAANTSVLSTTGAYSLTGSNAQSLIDLAGTWNTTGNPTAIKLNITNTASGANSLLMDLQVGGTPEFRVTRTGNVVVNGSTSTYQMHVVGTGSLLALGEESFTTGRQMLFGIDGSGNGEIQSVQQGTSYRNLSINPLGGNVGIATSSPTSTLHANGSVAKAITTKTATYTLTSSDHTVIFNLNGNATANLPDATTCTGRIYMIKINRTNTTDTLTIDPNGTQTIDGFTTYALQCQYAVIIQSDGSNWQILGDFANGTNCL